MTAAARKESRLTIASIASLVMFALLLAACGDDDERAAPALDDSSNVAVQRQGPAEGVAGSSSPIETRPNSINRSGALTGLVEVTLTGIGTAVIDAKARPIEPARRVGKADAALADLNTGIQLERLTTTSIDRGTRGAGGQRFVSAVFRVRNAPAACVDAAAPCAGYSVERKNITLIGASTASALGESAIREITRFDGTMLSGSVGASTARQMLPTHGMNQLVTSAEPGLESLQVFRESELPAPAGVRIFPYGFVVNHVSGTNRTLAANPADDQFDGIVTLSYSIPLTASTQDDPWSIRVVYQYAEDGNTRVTQSLEERNPAGELAVATRADKLLTADIVSLGCDQATTTIVAQPICKVRIAGDPGSANAAYLIDTPQPAQQAMLALSDEFNGSSLDRRKWCTRFVFGGMGDPIDNTPTINDPFCRRFVMFGGGMGDAVNDEQQRYRDVRSDTQAPLHDVSGGTLKLRASKTLPTPFANPQAGNFSQAPGSVNNGVVAWESAMISSKATFKPRTGESYLITARIKMPQVQGTFPQMWLYPELTAAGPQWPPEIDIMEGAYNVIDDNEKVLTQSARLYTVPGNPPTPPTQTVSGLREYTSITNELVNPNIFTYSGPAGFERQFHRYVSPTPVRNVWIEAGALWTTTGVCFYINNVQTACENYNWLTQFPAPTVNGPANPAVLILNMAIGGAYAGRYGIDPVDTGMVTEIDWVRTWRITN